MKPTIKHSATEIVDFLNELEPDASFNMATQYVPELGCGCLLIEFARNHDPQWFEGIADRQCAVGYGANHIDEADSHLVGAWVLAGIQLQMQKRRELGLENHYSDESCWATAGELLEIYNELTK